MKSNIISIKIVIFFTVFIMSLGSCNYKEIAESEYPEQLIYMPADYKGNYVINTVAMPIGNTSPGSIFRYKVDLSARKFIVPLGVYRSGINNNGAFMVDVTINTDTIAMMLGTPNMLPAGTLLLPSDKYTCATNVEMKDGKELASFDLTVDLDFLINNYPGKNYAIGVSISSTARKTNPNLATTIVVVGTEMMKPTANFTSAVSGADVKTWNFSSTSLMTVGFSWDFGDGSPASTLKAPIHTYVAAGTYTVTLTALGITDQENKSMKSVIITVL